MGFWARVMAALQSAWDRVKRSWIGVCFGYDLDPTSKRPGAKKLPFSEKEGYSVFNALATFALAQAAALTAVARGEEHKLLVIGIYAGTVITGILQSWFAADVSVDVCTLPGRP
jgi:hypothetical protein